MAVRDATSAAKATRAIVNVVSWGVLEVEVHDVVVAAIALGVHDEPPAASRAHLAPK